jgi:hypothetical protein
MKLGIMQPYFLPYIGYWQLMNAVDKYVIYDDVNFIKGGWVNRNNLLMNGKPCLFSIPLSGGSSFKKINEIKILPRPPALLKTVIQAYSKAPHFSAVYPLIENIIEYDTPNLALFIANSIRSVARYLDFKTEFMMSSDIEKDNALKGQEKVLAICKSLEASAYYNAIGGQELYSKEVFKGEGIDIHFLKTGSVTYKQFKYDFVPCLSILDVLMFNSIQEIGRILNQYELV